MAKNFPQFTAGKPIESFDSSFLNAMVALANAQPSPAPGGADTIPRQAGTVLVLNSTGADLEIGQPATVIKPAVSSTVDEDIFSTNLILEAISPVAIKGGWAVALQPIASGSVGRMCVAGLCVAKVSLTNPSHAYCDFDGTSLASANAGSAQILWKEALYGTRWCVVRLTNRNELTVSDTDYNPKPHLDQKITVTPGGGVFSWLDKSIITSGDTQKLLLTHGPWDSENLEDDGDVIGDIAAGNGITTATTAPAEEGYISYERYFDQYDANNHSQLTANPAYTTQYLSIPYYYVKVEAGGAAGFLKNKVSTTPAAGDNWLEQSVVNDTLLIEHSTLDPDQLGTPRPLVSIIDTGTNGVTIGSSVPASGRSYFMVNKANYVDDVAGHSETNIDDVTDEYVSWLELPAGTTAGDMLRWDGSKWATIAAPSSSGDYVLTSQDGAMSWVELSTFTCPT